MAAKSINLLAIVGPTASGKTALSIAIAKRYNGEIIAADSRTAYKFMDIGTAKPSVKEQAGVPHWGLDLVGPGQKLTAADFKKYAADKIDEINERQHIPIVVGGSGLYIDALLYDFNFAPANEKLRILLEKMTITKLQQEIQKRHLKMPENYQNKRYLIRTIERGTVIISRQPLPAGTLIVGINPGKELLKSRITKRAHQMIKEGVVNEIAAVSKQYGWGSEAMTAGIYKIFRPFLEGKISQEKAINNFIASDMRLAKKQITWFKRNQDIYWFTSVADAQGWLEKQISSKLK